MPMQLDIITAERKVYSGIVDQINAPTKDGRIGVLPRHMALLTILETGALDIIKDGESNPFAVSGGFMEILPTPNGEFPTRVTILANTVERADEIDAERAERARLRAEEQLRQLPHDAKDFSATESDLRRAIARLRVAEMRKSRRR